MIDFSFINSLQNTIKKNCLIIMSVISSTIQKLGLVTLYEQMVKLIIQSGRSLIKVLPIILEAIVYYLIMILAITAFLLMICFAYLMGNIQDCYGYFFRDKYQYKHSSSWIRYYRLLRIGIKKLPKLLYGLKSHLRLPS